MGKIKNILPREGYGFNHTYHGIYIRSIYTFFLLLIPKYTYFIIHIIYIVVIIYTRMFSNIFLFPKLDLIFNLVKCSSDLENFSVQ